MFSRHNFGIKKLKRSYKSVEIKRNRDQLSNRLNKRLTSPYISMVSRCEIIMFTLPLDMQVRCRLRRAAIMCFALFCVFILSVYCNIESGSGYGRNFHISILCARCVEFFNLDIDIRHLSILGTLLTWPTFRIFKNRLFYKP